MTQPEMVQAITVRAGIKLYIATGIKPNRLWSPKAMKETAARICGKPSFRNLPEAYKGLCDRLSEEGA